MKMLFQMLHARLKNIYKHRIHLENIFDILLGFLGKPSGKAERTPNPTSFFS